MVKVEHPKGKPFLTHAHGLNEDERPFGERLKFWRMQRGLSQLDAGKLLGANAGAINRWERGAEPSDVPELVSKLREGQEKAGETPGEDDADSAESLWRAHLAEA